MSSQQTPSGQLAISRREAVLIPLVLAVVLVAGTSGLADAFLLVVAVLFWSTLNLTDQQP
ncbi:hypothetical protein QRX50_34860 [Amycolatopsis carbonis]|uniref:Uncharacterized protein n=1 Tax=Amycolatopsis carbonis TaxID=715471 RepID=A0A9Y2IAQ8_9PSEU|nr:hypothetical protein [Amycolatopsis sp. 2-15]WIX76612.1 hypothetical protein QRX50_34860 [Amycolatopsis sp. 2-15]